MSVYFVYRSHYEGPSGKHVRVLAGDSVLGWFRSVWKRAKRADDAGEWVESEIGTGVFDFESLFGSARDEDLPPPASDRKLQSYLEEYLQGDTEVLYRPHAIQVLTDDDEVELAYYIFDDHFLAEHPGRAAYLLHEDWRLPVTHGEGPYSPAIETRAVDPKGTGPGATYLAFLTFYDSLSLDLHDRGPIRIDGLRLPQLADHLRQSEPDRDWPLELRLLRTQLLPDDSGEGGLRRALERVARLPVLQLGGTAEASSLGLGPVAQAAAGLEGVLAKLPASRHGFDPSKSLIGSGDHMAQLCLHTGWEDGIYHQWILYDDLWAAGHRDLADGVLRYAKRWDILS